MFRALLILGALGVLIPLASLAADGEGCNIDTTQITMYNRGVLRPVWCITLVDDETSDASDGTPAPVTSDLTSVGLPDAVSFLVGSDNDCSAGTITLTTALSSSGGQDGLDSPNPTLDLARAATTRINVDLHQFPIGPFVITNWASVAGCSGGFDIIAVGYEYLGD